MELTGPEVGLLSRGAFGSMVGRATVVTTSSPSDHVYKVIELVGTSEKSIDDAIKTAISRASATLKHMRWFEVTQTRGHLENGAIRHYQVTMKVGFTLES